MVEVVTSLQPGQYVYSVAWREWVVKSPEGDFCSIGPKSGHTVLEHVDGTITVSPSIQFAGLGRGKPGWHGHLREGRWESC